MIIRTAPAWQKALSEAIRHPHELLAELGVEPSAAGVPDDAERARRQFPLRVPRSFVARMRPGDPDDPLLRQVLPIAREVEPSDGYELDPLDEARYHPVPGVLHKYKGRALWLLTGACAVHCRYCFRRHFPYAESTGRGGWDGALAYFAADPTIEEVILSGGDPLTLTDEHLSTLAERLAAIPHVERLRVHSRLPVVLPERVDEALLGWLGGTRLRPVMVIHANHPNELDDDVQRAIGRLRGAGVTVLNQAVLLAGINDRLETLRRLCLRCFEVGALPYYLHRLDRVQGAAHFGVSHARAERLAGALARTLPGYLVPRVVQEVPGAPAKILLDVGEASFELPDDDELEVFDGASGEPGAAFGGPSRPWSREE